MYKNVIFISKILIFNTRFLIYFRTFDKQKKTILSGSRTNFYERLKLKCFQNLFLRCELLKTFHQMIFLFCCNKKK